MEQQAETVLTQDPAICRQYTTLSVLTPISHITTARKDQLLHEKQLTTLEKNQHPTPRQKKKTQEKTPENKHSGVCSPSPFLCTSVVTQ